MWQASASSFKLMLRLLAISLSICNLVGEINALQRLSISVSVLSVLILFIIVDIKLFCKVLKVFAVSLLWTRK